MTDVKIINKKEKGNNRHWKNFIDKNYLGSHNLEDGEEMLLTITRFEGEEEVQSSDGKKSKKPVLYFKEDVPKMIMNITNGNIIANLYGNQPEKWIGKQIQLFSASIKAFGEQRDALRIRDFAPKIEVDESSCLDKLNSAKTLDDLKKVWGSFKASEQNNKALIRVKDNLKTKLK